MKNEEKPLVSIVITNYNYREYLYQSIESAINQTYKNTEILLIDDASTDNSEDVWKKFSGSIRVIKHTKNKGIVFSRNEALSKVKGDFLCFLDADDYFDDTYIEGMVAVAESSGADVVYPNWRVFGEDNYIKEYSDFDVQKLIRQEIHCTSESLIRLSSVKDCKFESGEVAEDWDFFLGLALGGRKFKLAKKCYINYRVRRNTRGTSRPYWDDMYYFVSILQKWHKKYPNKVNPIDLPVYAGTIRDQQIASCNEIINQKNNIIAIKDAQIESIISSKSYRMSRALSIAANLPKRVKNIVYKLCRISIIPLISFKQHATKFTHKKEYSKIDGIQIIGKERNNEHKLAVVIHLFYTDNWEIFYKRLKLLPKDSFDVFITMPNGNSGFEDTIYKYFPDAKIIYVRNMGRDVLPFIEVAAGLKQAGYETVLKFHSKKSTHRSDGQDWLESMLNQIIPEDEKALISILEATKNPNFGVLGPADVYYPLTINFPANGIHLTKIIKDCFNRKVARESLQLNRKRYGFFGGTMFWVNLSSIEPLLKYKQSNFEKEAGQIDGTFAHAIERAFCLVPELSGKDIYQSDGKNITKRSYESDNIPDWSEDHDK